MGKIPRYWLPLLLAFSIGGLISSLLVVYLFYMLGQLPPGCYADVEILPGVTADCVKVLKSEYAYIGPFPLDVLAAVWFMVNIGAVLWMYFTLSAAAMGFIWWWRLLGLAVVPYLVYLELAVLKAVCIYCTVMHVMIIADFLIITLFLKSVRRLNILRGPRS